jgi:flagellar hook assembly protein FlgD
VASAHGYLGRRLGAGQVDFARALAHVIPTSAPTRLNVHGSAGRLRLAAGSTARAVAFRVDGGPRLGPVPVVFGAASLRWPSWGYANGWHRVTAVDCTAYRECARTSTSVTFKIANAAPVVSAPTRGSTITGGFTVKASSTGGGLRLIIDGRAHGFDRTAPYTLAYTGSALSQGWHTLYVRQCSRDRRHCLGPASLGVPFRSNSLRPTIVSVSPSVFSPNGDGRRDTTTVTYTLPIEQTVQVSVVNRLGLTIHGRQLGTQRKGLHTWVWKGDGIAGLRAANGRYSLRINTSKVVSGVTVRGSVSRIVRLDTIAPHLSAVTGSGASFFPYRDGYRDTFEPAARLDEGGTLTLRIRDSAGRLVRSLSAAKASGPVSLSWNGHTDSGAPAAAGRYRWNFTVTDQAANRRQSWTWSVSLSWQRLVAKRATLTRDGDAYYATGAPPCAVVDESTSSYDDGVDLLNGCSYEAEGDQVAKASYRFALPDAPVYFRMSVRAYGFSSHWPPN